MFVRLKHRLDFADTRALSPESLLTVPNFRRFEQADPIEQMRLAEAADRTLLQLVICAALATLVLAAASTLGA
jgi:hypothetical protein